MFYMMERTAVGVEAASWIGGLPKISQASWPRSEETGLPLHFIAQIDLSSTSEHTNVLGLPGTGFLVFFVDTYFEGSAHDYGLQPKVLYLEEKFEFSSPPDDIPRVFGSAFAYAKKFHSDHPVDRFYRTPVNLIWKDWGDYSAWFKDVGAAYDDIFNVSRDGPPFRIAAKQLNERLQEEFRRIPFYGTRESESRKARYTEEQITVIERLKHLTGGKFQAEARKQGYYIMEKTPEAALEKAKNKLALSKSKMTSLPSGKAVLKPILDRLSEIYRAGQPFDSMTMSEYEGIVAMGEKTPFRNDLHQGLPRQMRGVLAELAFGKKRDITRIPKTALKYWNTHLYSAQGPHVFAVPFEPQPDLPADQEHSVLLLQIASDPVMGFSWGDVGAIQFWINPDSLRNHQWSDVMARLASASMNVYHFAQ